MQGEITFLNSNEKKIVVRIIYCGHGKKNKKKKSEKMYKLKKKGGEMNPEINYATCKL